jgi:hypothetical protein
MSAILRKYATATAAGTHIRVPVIKAGAVDFAASGDWTPAAGDVKLSKDGGAQANIGTLPTYTNGAWQFQLTGTELTCQQLEIMVVDSATKAVEDQCVIVETYGHVSAMHVTEKMSAAIVASTALTGTLSTTQMTTNLTEVTDEHYTGRTLIWISGNLAGQATDVTAYNGTTKMLTYTAVTEAPANTDEFILV